MIRAIIFDCFGVLATEGWLPFKEQYFGHDADLARQASELMEQANAGFIAHQDFMASVADMAGIESKAVKATLWHNEPNKPLFDYLHLLQADYKLGILSNAAVDRLSMIFNPEQLGLFSAVVLSFETRLTKPDPRIYRLAAQKLGVLAEDCVFIDDQEWYVTAAKDIGMRGIWYQDFAVMRRELQHLLAK